MRRTVVLGSICATLLSVGCGKTELCGSEHSFPCDIAVDWCNCVEDDPPLRTHLLAYPSGGGTPVYFGLPDEKDGATLPRGRYDMVFFNAEESTGVAFRRMESFGTAEVYLPSQAGRAGEGDDYPVGKPGIVYVAARTGVEIPGGPVPLVPKVAVQLIRLEVRIDDRDDIRTCEGRLTGVSVALNLATGAPSREQTGTLCFTARSEGGVFRDELVVFGVNPAVPDKPAVPNVLSLTLTDGRGETKRAEIDLTERMDGFTDPTADLAVQLTPLPLEMRVTVAGWKTGTDGWGSLDRPAPDLKTRELH